jgi:hypothetical protein
LTGVTKRRTAVAAAVAVSTLMLAGGGLAGLTQTGGATVSVSSARAGARPVALTITIATELRCGRLNSPSVVVRLPTAARVPARVARTAVRVGGAVAARVSVTGHTLTVGLPHSGPNCNTIAPGVVRVVITRAANVGNPPSAGRYVVVVSAGVERWSAVLGIR